MEETTVIRLVECAYTVAGAFAGKLFADLGWDVIKIEPRDAGDPNRGRGPFATTPTGSKKSLLFEYLNTNKKGITLNLLTAEGQTIFRHLAEVADVLIVDLDSDSCGRIPDYQELAEMNRGLTMVEITPFGKTGPYRDYRVRPANVPHLGGVSWVLPSGLAQRMFPERGPVGPGGNLSEYFIGSAAAVAALIALLSRMVTGEGQYVDFSKQEALVTFARRGLGLLLNYNLLETRMTADYPYGGCVPCRDGFIEIHVISNRHWSRFVEVMGNPEWTKQDTCKDGAARGQNGDMIRNRIEEWARERSKKEIYNACLKHGVPAGPFYSPLELLESEQLKARGYFKEASLPELGNVRFPTLPFQMSNYSWGLRHPAPALGADNHDVYCGLLGYTRSKLVQWNADGVI